MAKAAPAKSTRSKESAVLAHVRIQKHTSIGGGILKTSSMNKATRRCYKKYKGQGR